MGRKLQFDKHQALTMAMENFWARGYGSTSMRTLADSLGLHLGSVYNALGDKEEMFEKSLRLNYDDYVLPALQALGTSDRPLEALDEMFEKVLVECAGTENNPGCFMINSLLEIASLNDSITSTVHEYLGKAEDGFTACMARAVTLGHLPSNTDVTKKARCIIAALFSMRVMGKLKMPLHFIRDIKQGALDAVRAA